MGGLSADTLRVACKVFFSEFGIPQKIMLDVGGNFISGKFKEFCKKNEHKAISIVFIPPAKDRWKHALKFWNQMLKKAQIPMLTHI